MTSNDWRLDVARLLEATANNLRQGSDRTAVSNFNAALGYMDLARRRGELAACLLLEQTNLPEPEVTHRFRYVPGEVEAIQSQRPPRGR